MEWTLYDVPSDLGTKVKDSTQTAQRWRKSLSRQQGKGEGQGSPMKQGIEVRWQKRLSATMWQVWIWSMHTDDIGEGRCLCKSAGKFDHLDRTFQVCGVHQNKAHM